MPRLYPLCAFALLCASIAVGCGKKDDTETGGGGGSDGAPVLRPRTADEKQDAARQLRQIGIAMHNYHDAQQTFPAGIMGPSGRLGLSWRVAILPYLDEQRLYKEFKLDEPWDSEHNKKLLTKMPKCYESPGVVISHGKTYLRAFAGPSGFILAAPMGPRGPAYNPWPNQPPGSPARGRRMADMTDGTSNTLMVVEAADPVEWTKPDELPFPDTPGNPSAPVSPLPKLGGLFDGGFHALLCDGSVRFISHTVSEKTLRALISVNGGEVVDFDEREPRKPEPTSKPAPTNTREDSRPNKAKW